MSIDQKENSNHPGEDKGFENKNLKKTPPHQFLPT